MVSHTSQGQAATRRCAALTGVQRASHGGQHAMSVITYRCHGCSGQCSGAHISITVRLRERHLVRHHFCCSLPAIVAPTATVGGGAVLRSISQRWSASAFSRSASNRSPSYCPKASCANRIPHPIRIKSMREVNTFFSNHGCFSLTLVGAKGWLANKLAYYFRHFSGVRKPCVNGRSA